MNMKTLLIVAGLAFSAAAMAQPSMYYLWKNSTTGEVVCEPEEPGQGWVKVDERAYSDSTCKTPF